jgi:Zn2+/Cd2+-exporting ATPase
MVEEAQASKAPAQRFVDVFARYYTPSVVVAAALVALAPPLLFDGSWSGWFYRALILLVVACPCALVISTPVSIVSAIAAAARDGVLIKGGAHLEALGSLRVLAFDKTGTLTLGKPEVQQIVSLNGVDEHSILRLAASAERYSEHPLGRAIVRSAEARGIELASADVSGTSTTTGSGISARVDGRLIEVGSRRMVDVDSLSAETEEQLQALERQGQTAVIVMVDGTPEGVIAMADQLRPEARESIAAIHASGIEQTVMLTGDRADVAAVIAEQVGIDSVNAELMPDQKVNAIAALLDRYGSVGMVGDGVNDAPALARATVGIAMGAAGTDTALETADVALMGDGLGKLANVVKLSRRTKGIIIQNIALALAIKAVVLILAIAGLATLWQAIFADVGASLIVILNGLRLLRRS